MVKKRLKQFLKNSVETEILIKYLKIHKYKLRVLRLNIKFNEENHVKQFERMDI